MASLHHLTPFSSTRPTLVTAQHSQVRQEAEYIQERIAAAECLYRRLTAEITKTQHRLVEARKHKSSDGLTNSLKRSIRKKRSRLNRCVKNRQAFEARLATIFAEMDRMEQRQWRHSSPNLPDFGRSHVPEDRNASIAVPSWTTSYMSTPSVRSTVQTLDIPTIPMQLQSLHHAVPIHTPQTPVIRPTQFSQITLGRPHEQDLGFSQAGNDAVISPSDTVSSYELNSPNGFPVTYIPAAHQADVLDALHRMHISTPQESHTQPSSIPTTAIGQGNIDFSHRLRMFDHQSAAFRLERAARKHKGHRSC
ncbi:hypothetical protein Z517_05062 [Fonsecaea pedrosoi CBS 271.37]|uniref:Uncharacterized protein n=1 Tax=Fonsecaea pedrosoi CBS 271.37 TaxID=1442368 RepID=A0A0D2GU14_9EURO|nr:uncharacterized protein Z517_05062 [Fonsecaea pedrosoi CBS 271.37]KIW82035.1 hypothetical protein Z517_05062 [Fonsecaea pedrosoi CBS 271.37]